MAQRILEKGESMIVEFNDKQFKVKKTRMEIKLDNRFYTLDEIREKIKVYDKDGEEVKDYDDVELLSYLHQINLIRFDKV